MLENALLAFLTRLLENYWTELHQPFSIDAFWDRDELFCFLGSRVKVQGNSMTKGPAGVGTQNSTH